MSQLERYRSGPNILTLDTDEGVVYLRVPEPVSFGAESDRLAWQIVDECQRIREAKEQPIAIALIGLGAAFFVHAPRSAKESF